MDRRTFVRAAGTAAALGALPRTAAGAPSRALSGYEPWLEVSAETLRANAREVGRLAGRRPVLAVVKNNAYGLGIARVGPALSAAPEVWGFGVVKPAEAHALLDARVTKPILLMGLASDDDAVDLARRGVRLAPFSNDAPRALTGIRQRAGVGTLPVHLYLDTGMGRLGLPYHRARGWMEEVAGAAGITVEGIFTALTEDDGFDAEQLTRFTALLEETRPGGVRPAYTHAASSHALFFRQDPGLTMVRPGLALFGAYPAGARERGLADLEPAFRLKAKVVRVERLRPGDSVSYGRNYVAERPVWVATLPVGHADGYPRKAVEGAEVLIGGRTYPVIGAVSASHAIVEIGDWPTVAVGDDAVLVGPDHPAVHPNTLAERAGISVYDVLMHLSAGLPGVMV